VIKVFHQLEDLSLEKKPLHLALGVFDGVHVGHQKVIQNAVDAAKASGGVAGVLTFSPHPIQVLAPDRAPMRILASLQHKAILLEELGCEMMVVQKFSKEFAGSSAKGFIQSINDACQNLQSLSVGEDWVFGKGREGSVVSLKEWGEVMRIRQAIRDGNLESIAAMLGRPYMVMGEVLRGRQLARQLGFPTANIKVFNEQLPPDGVWEVKVRVDGEWFSGVGNLGKRPTVENDVDAQRLLEVHLFDFNQDVYGKELGVRFIKYVREEMKFDSIEALKSQIEKDVQQVQSSKC